MNAFLRCVLAIGLAVVIALLVVNYAFVEGPATNWIAGVVTSTLVWFLLGPRVGFGDWKVMLGASAILLFAAWLLASQNWWDYGHDLAVRMLIGCIAVLVVNGVSGSLGGNKKVSRPA